MLQSLLLAFALIDGDPTVDGPQFDRLIKTRMSVIRDVSFVFEGTHQYVGAKDVLKANPEEFHEVFQGTYARRADGATMLDVYHRHPDHAAVYVRDTEALLNGRLTRLTWLPELKQIKPASINGAPGALFHQNSAERILFFWCFGGFLTDARLKSFHSQGWETIDGQRCLHVRFDLFPGIGTGPKEFLHFWVDMERGGHPLKYETRRGEEVVNRTDQIVLKRFSASGAPDIWLPVSGRYQTFTAGEKVFKSPFFEETYSVVGKTVFLNSGLKDFQFDVFRQEGLPATPQMKMLRKEIEKRPTKASRTDPRSVAKDLAMRLEGAQSQAKGLEAVPESSQDSFWVNASQFGLVFLGVALIGGVGYYKWKNK